VRKAIPPRGLRVAHGTSEVMIVRAPCQCRLHRSESRWVQLLAAKHGRGEMGGIASRSSQQSRSVSVHRRD
jgi:hypothetical protein